MISARPCIKILCARNNTTYISVRDSNDCQGAEGTLRPKKMGRTYDVKNAETLMALIFLLDGYRIHHYEEIGWVDKVVKAGDLGLSFRKDWKDVRKILVRMATVPPSLIHLMKWAVIQRSLQLTRLITSTFTLIIIGASLFFLWGRNPAGTSWIMLILQYIGIPLFVILIVTFFGPIIIARKIDSELSKFREKHPERFRESTSLLRVIVQKLIDSLAHHARSSKVKTPDYQKIPRDPLVSVDSAFRGFINRIFRRKTPKKNEYSFELFKVDYKGIRIIKKPRRLRKHYIVAPERI